MESEVNEQSGDAKARGRPRGWHDKTEQNTIKSLDRAMGVLERLGDLGEATLTGLSKEVDQSPSSVYRVLVTLNRRGIVDFDPARQVWAVGAGAFLIGSKFLQRTSLVERARPIMRELMQQTGETANLGVETHGKVLFVSQVETQASIRAFFPPGTLSSMHASGIGKALLAYLDPKRLEKIMGASGLEQFTKGTLVTEAALRADLDQTRHRGFAFDDEERNLGMRCVAAPVFDIHNEVVAGISVSGPTARIGDGDVVPLSGFVKAAAASLTRAIGGVVAAD